ncbi:MAG: hypothetical protein CL840_17030 [Crocinitomicaceae bacterium]|mgnify:CR=1 FL=1|nr:hypothetical protein [Crocinitomicaceae bacterium]|tara:strand:+ start:5297 stop:7444 length:2148 start_codon:yes stop_codon:yes gene_type:complete
MKRKIVQYGTMALIAAVGILNLNYKTNPPLGRTGRTSSNCTGCHRGTLNPSGGSFSLTGISTGYYPGRVYSLNVTGTGGSIYGFEMTSVQSSSTNTGKGTFSSSTGVGVSTLSSRSYARQSVINTNGSWKVTWTAPAVSTGTTTIYLCGVSGNNNRRDTGDKTYTLTKTLTELKKISFTVTTTSSGCPGDSLGIAKVTGVTGGAGNYRYAWSQKNANIDSLTGLWAGTYTVSVYDVDSNMEKKNFTISALAGLQGTAGQQPTICNDSTGKAWFKPNGGVPPYSYSWPSGISVSSDTAVNLKKGSYVLTVSDSKGCASQKTISVGEDGTNIKNVFSIQHEHCKNGLGSAEVVSATGVAGAPKYNWTGGSITNKITNKSAGTYYLRTIDTANCIQVDTIQINNLISLDSVSLTKGDDNCVKSLGWAKVNFTRGELGMLSYKWNNAGTRDSIGGLVKGMYVVTVTDSVNCSVVGSIHVLDSDAPTLSVNGTNLKCNGDSTGTAVGSAIGGTPPLVYLWSNGKGDTSLSQLGAGVYKLTVTDSMQCFAFDSVVIREPDKLDADSAYQSSQNILDTCDESAQVRIKGGTRGYTYLWNNGGKDSVITKLCAGTYTVKITDANGCTLDTSIAVKDWINTGIEMHTSSQWKIYPNPARDELHIQGNGNTLFNFRLVDLKGTVVHATGEKSSEYSVDVSRFHKGQYVLFIEWDSGIEVKSVIIN